MKNQRNRKTQVVLPSDTPVFYRNYKEPLRSVQEVKGEGYGYMGTIATDETGNYVQCHICGRLYEYLGWHLRFDHRTTADDYKREFGLLKKTALAGERVRQASAVRAAKLLSEGKLNTKGLTMNQGHNKGKRIALEARNVRGTCPDQTIEAIRKLAEELGRTPTVKEFAKTKGAPDLSVVKIHFGSWSAAVKIAGLKPYLATSQGEKLWDEAAIVVSLKEFHRRYRRTPTTSDFLRGVVGPTHTAVTREFGTLNNARAAAGIPQLVRSPGGHNNYVEAV